jgi:hypothetical protein
LFQYVFMLSLLIPNFFIFKLYLFITDSLKISALVATSDVLNYIYSYVFTSNVLIRTYLLKMSSIIQIPSYLLKMYSIILTPSYLATITDCTCIHMIEDIIYVSRNSLKTRLFSSYYGMKRLFEVYYRMKRLFNVYYENETVV